MFFSGLLCLMMAGVFLIMLLMAIGARGIAEDRKKEDEDAKNAESNTH